MLASRPLTIVSLCAVLGACASRPPPLPPPAPAATAAAAPAPAASAPAAEGSIYGLYLAGHVASQEGRLGAAAAYLERAAAAAGATDAMKAAAFEAALKAGDVPTAAMLAPTGDDVLSADKRLGIVVRGVEAAAEGKDKAAYALLATDDMGYPYRMVAHLVAPYAAAAAGDAADAVARPSLGGDAIGQFIGDLDQAELEARLGQPKAAETAYKALMQNGDPSGLVTAAYGAFLERRGRAKEAAALYQTRLAHVPDDAHAAATLARAQKHGRPPPLGGLHQDAAAALIIPSASLISQKQNDTALEYLRLALRLDPANDEAWMLVGDLTADDDPDTARGAYGRVAPTSERYVSARGKLAWSYQNAGDHTEALKLARETVVAAPNDREAAMTLADLLRVNEQYAESASVLTRLIEAPDAKPDWRLYFMRASAYDEVGDAQKTQGDLTQALKLNPDEPELLNFQGYFWIDRGEHLKEALAMVQKAVDAEPQSGAMVDSLGWGYYRLGDYKTAVETLEQAVQLDPSIPEVNDHLGDAYWRVGRKTEAQFQWRRVLGLDPEPALKARAEAKLASPLGPDAPQAPAAPAKPQ
jgi:tetratricopeptide (TPR) repeat protein